MDINNIENLNLKRVLERNSAEIIYDKEDMLLINDKISNCFMFACNNTEKGIILLDQFINKDTELILITNPEVGRQAIEKYDFEGVMECYQMAYLKEEIPSSNNSVKFRIATENDFLFIRQHYDLIAEAELHEVIRRGNIILGLVNNTPIGFIGEHLEGSIGMLFVLPEHRRKGYAQELEKAAIRKTIEQGYIPYGQVEIDNHASLALQKSLGLTQSENTIIWLWR